jgi:hypothetical protein
VKQYHVQTMGAVPSPFEGSLTLTVSDFVAIIPFSAEVIGYDYSATPTSTPTITKTPTPANTPSPTPTRTPFTINLPIIREGY